MSGNISIGMAFDNPNRLCNSVGDTLCISAILEKLSEEKGDKLIMCAQPQLYDLWLNNPYLKGITSNIHPTINIIPCREVSCNIVRYYVKQLNLNASEPILPKIYLTLNEIEWGKNQLKEFDGYKKIAISTETGYDSKNLRAEYISPLLDRLKEQNYKLISVGINHQKQYNKYDKSFTNKTTLREVFSIIKTCDLFIGIDNGLFHSAAALDIPQVIFFRNNQSSNNAYYNTYFIDSNIKCQGDCLNHRKFCSGLVRCMDNFDLNKYYNMINNILNI